MNRREVLVGAGAIALAATTAAIAADKEDAAHDHGAAAGLGAAIAGCLQAGEACLAHCHVLLGSGDSSLAACAKTVSDMLAVDGALLRLASTGSAHAGELAKVVVAVSRECEAECRKHQDKHPVCKACAESCAVVIAAAGKSAA